MRQGSPAWDNTCVSTTLNDHIIISQAITERMKLISSDRKFSFYLKQKLELVFNER
jgi:hypothetical protein